MMVRRLVVGIRTLALALLGILFAREWLSNGPRVPLAIILTVLVVGLVCELLGRTSLPENPVPAVYFLEAAAVVPFEFVAVFSGSAVIAAGKLNALLVTREPQKTLITSAIAAAVACVGAAIVAVLGDDKDSMLAAHIKRVFQRHYGRKGDGDSGGRQILFDAESRGERLVFSDEYEGIVGWDFAARRERAKGIAAVLTK